MYMTEENSREEIDPDLDVEEDIRISDDREKHRKYIVKKNINENGKVHAIKVGGLQKIEGEIDKNIFFVDIPHLKGGMIVWNF